MSIPVQCPACQQTFAVADRFAGKRGKCPKCGAVFQADAVAPDDGVAVFPELPPPPALEPQSQGEEEVATFPVAAPTPQPQPGPPPQPAPRSREASPAAGSQSRPAPVAAAPVAVSAPLISADGAPRARRAASSPSSPLPIIIGAAVGAMALLGAIIGVVWSLSGSDGARTPVAQVEDDPAETEVDPATVDPPVVAPPVATPAIDRAALAALRPRVFPLEIQTATGTSRAVCFLVGERGLAVTCHHAIAPAVSVAALTTEELKIPVAGTVAIDPAYDLAIIKLAPNLPIPLEPLALATDAPAAGAEIAALDLSSPASAAQVGRLRAHDAFGRLSPSMRARLKNVAQDWDDRASMIMHDLLLAESNCGAPLLSREGQAIGLHIAADGGSGVAVSARHIRELLARAGEVRPFTGESVAVAPTPPAGVDEPLKPLDPTPSPMPPPMSPPRPDDPIDDLIARIEEHRAACEKGNWTAHDEREYAQFQLLAQFLTTAASGAEQATIPEEKREKLSAAVRAALFSLTAEKWPTDAQWKKTNEQAAKAFDAAPGQGVFALARVVVPVSQGNMIGGVPIAIVEITGESQMLVVPMTEGGEKFPFDQQLLVIGQHDPGALIRYNNLPTPLVRAKYLLAVAPQD